MNALRTLSAGLLLATCLLSSNLHAQVQMQRAPQGQLQGTPQRQMQQQQPQAALPGRAQPAFVEIISILTVPFKPKFGDPVVVKVTLRNAGQTTVAQVPWAIHWQTANQTLAEGVLPNFPPGAVAEVTANWKAVGGEHLIQGYVDASGRAFNNAAPITARIRNVPLNIAEETQLLSFVKARDAGASFRNTLLPGSPTWCDTFGVSPVRETPPNKSAYFITECVAITTSTGEAFINFKLKNGWIIKSIKPEQFTDAMSGNREFIWQYRLPPQIGSNDPHMIVETAGIVGGVTFEITIAGHPGSDPYIGLVR
jgi:hypothetical protein